MTTVAKTSTARLNTLRLTVKGSASFSRSFGRPDFSQVLLDTDIVQSHLGMLAAFTCAFMGGTNVNEQRSLRRWDFGEEAMLSKLGDAVVIVMNWIQPVCGSLHLTDCALDCHVKVEGEMSDCTAL